MKMQQILSFPAAEGETGFGSAAPAVAWTWSAMDADQALAAARARLAASSKLYERRKSITNGPYYEGNQKPEEIIASASLPAALVTRNHYGSLVLNASRAMFIDVDVVPQSRVSRWLELFRGRRTDRWRHTLEDLRTVLWGEREEGFRLYRTAAGFRILATTREYEPGSARSERLMHTVGADSAFVHFCRAQQSFRARLTPKPWRCNTPKPPNAFPRESESDQQRYAAWLADYERACRDRATCQFLGHVGPEIVHEHIAPVIEMHDRETRAFAELPLA